MTGPTQHPASNSEGRKRQAAQEPAESYTAAQIHTAYVKHSHADDWGVPVFYENGLLSALRGEYDDLDGGVL